MVIIILRGRGRGKATYVLWLAPCDGSIVLTVVRTSSHELCSSSHHYLGNHSMHPPVGSLYKNTTKILFSFLHVTYCMRPKRANQPKPLSEGMYVTSLLINHPFTANIEFTLREFKVQ